MSADNLKIWKQVEETPPSATRFANLDGRQVTSINGIHFVKLATDVFGPVGIGWGYDIVEERFDKAEPIYIVDENKVKTLACHAVMHTIKLKVWYKLDGKEGHVYHYGHTPYIRSSKYGPYTDFEAPKKSLTDAMKKCLSMLGFSADIYMGMFDDINYVEAAKVKESIAKADENDAEVAEQRKAFLEWCEREIKQYQLIPNAAAIKLVHQGHLRKLERQCATLGFNTSKFIERFNEASKERIDQLTPDCACSDCGTVQKGKDGSTCVECGGKLSRITGDNGVKE